MRSAAALLLFVGLSLSACSALTDDSSARVCAAEAEDFGPEFRVAGSFTTTVGRLRSLEPRVSSPERWPDLAAAHAAVVCFLDGPVAFSPPGGQQYDRAVVGVADSRAEMLMAGYKTNIPVRAP